MIKGRVISYPGSLLVLGTVLVLVVWVVVVTTGTFSIGRLENREDNFEKNEDLAAWLIADVSCVVSAE